MYEQILIKRYKEAVDEFGQYGQVDSLRRTITFHDCKEIESLSDNSDVIVWFDGIAANPKPLLLVERIPAEECNIENITEMVIEFNEDSISYAAVVKEREDVGFVDVTIVCDSVYEAIAAKGGL